MDRPVKSSRDLDTIARIDQGRQINSGVMDFSRVPFTSALKRLSHLVPIAAFVRISTLQPQLRDQFPTRHFYMITTNRVVDGPVTLTFRLALDGGEEKGQITYESAEAVLNEGPVSCSILHLHRADAIPVEAVVACDFLSLFTTESDVLPFLHQKAECIWFGHTPTLSALPLAQVCAHIQPRIEDLAISITTFPDAEDLSQFKLPLRPEAPLKLFRLQLPDFERLLLWLRKNVAFLAQGHFCRKSIVNCDQLRAGWHDEVAAVLAPFFRDDIVAAKTVTVGTCANFVCFGCTVKS